MFYFTRNSTTALGKLLFQMLKTDSLKNADRVRNDMNVMQYLVFLLLQRSREYPS